MSARIRMAILITVAGLGAPRAYAGPAKMTELPFTAQVPSEAKDPRPWLELTNQLLDSGRPYGALAAASRMLVFFTDLPSKEHAYQTIIAVVDRGYSYPVDALFVPGDIEPPSGTNFANSYYLFKYIINKDKGLARWSDHYLAFIGKDGDKDKVPKSLFYQALVAYGQKDLPKAIELLRKVLAGDLTPEQQPFVRKVARTLARAYFDNEEYAKALDVYTSFLLKLDPLTPSDWLETAWSYYHLKRYPEALGMLYNLESHAASQELNLEKYTIRALSYRALCSLPHAETLLTSFEKDFGDILKGIKRGEPLAKYPGLNSLNIPENLYFRSVLASINGLQQEQEGLGQLPAALAPIASYLYASELKMLQGRTRFYQDRALTAAAAKIVLMDESLKFLKFDVARAKFNPDTVFKQLGEGDQKAVDTSEDGERYTLHWLQSGDFWRDERRRYKGDLASQCTD